MRNEVKIWQTILVGVICAAFSASLTYSAAMMKIHAVVENHSVRLSTTERDITENRRASSEHMKEAIDLFRQSMETQKETMETQKASVEAHKRSVEAFERAIEALERSTKNKA